MYCCNQVLSKMELDPQCDAKFLSWWWKEATVDSDWIDLSKIELVRGCVLVGGVLSRSAFFSSGHKISGVFTAPKLGCISHPNPKVFTSENSCWEKGLCPAHGQESTWDRKQNINWAHVWHTQYTHIWETKLIVDEPSHCFRYANA